METSLLLISRVGKGVHAAGQRCSHQRVGGRRRRRRSAHHRGRQTAAQPHVGSLVALQDGRRAWGGLLRPPRRRGPLLSSQRALLATQPPFLTPAASAASCSSSASVEEPPCAEAAAASSGAVGPSSPMAWRRDGCAASDGRWQGDAPRVQASKQWRVRPAGAACMQPRRERCARQNHQPSVHAALPSPSRPSLPTSLQGQRQVNWE